MKPSLLLLCVVGLVSCIPRERLRKRDSNDSLEPLPEGGDGGRPSPPLMLRSSLSLVEDTDQQIISHKGGDGLPDKSLQERHEPDEPATLAQTDRHDFGSHEPSKRGQFLSTIKNKSKRTGKKPKYSKVTGTRKTDSIIFLKYTDDDSRKDEKSSPSSWEQLSFQDPVNHKYTKRGIKGKLKNASKQKPWPRYSRLNTTKETDDNNKDLIKNSEYSDSDDDDERRPLLRSQRKNLRNSLNSQRQRSWDITKRGFFTTFKTKAKNLFKKKPRDSNQHYSKKLRHSKPDRSTEMDSNERDDGRRYHNAEHGSSYEDEDDGYGHHRRKREDHKFLDRTLRSFVVLSSHLQKNMTHNTTSLPADTVSEELNKGQASKYLTEDLNENQEDEGEEHQNENLSEDQAKEDKAEMTENLSEDNASEDESKEHEGQEDEYEAEGKVSGLDD